MRFRTIIGSILLLGSFANATELSEDTVLSSVRATAFYKVYEKYGKDIRLSIMLQKCNEKETAEMFTLPEDAIAETIVDYLISIKTNPKNAYYPLISKMSSSDMYERIVEDVNGYVTGYKVGFKEGTTLSDNADDKAMCKFIKEKALTLVSQNLKHEKAQALKQ